MAGEVALDYSCRECGLDFETAPALANHKGRFCVGQVINASSAPRSR
jgi:hypothetical protein